ncbi:MAG: histidine--tRNA ligase [Armatimonadetes bacterium]|nr:histidine--tRNA ligase [Armatimonadota bacterium]
MRYRRPRGTQDILPDQAGEWQLAESTFRHVARCFGYGEIRTPMFEETDLFTRSVGEETDLVSKEMYTFTDRGGRSLTLRAEGTAPVVRAFLENNMQGADREKVVKLYYLAPVFRYERPQAGRFRQHHQAGAEVLGSPSPAVDAEVIHLALTFYRRMGIEQVRLLINSVGCPACRPAYVERLRAFLAEHRDELCADCQRRLETNTLRVLDCKQQSCQPVLEAAPKMVDHLCDDCAAHFQGVQEHLKALGIEYVLQPRIVRGLDYYTKTAFEFVSVGLGAQDAIGGGGRYDGLVEDCGGPPTPGVGFGIGLERVLMVREALGVAGQDAGREGVFVVALGEEAWLPAYKLAAQLREAGVMAELDYRRRSLRAQIKQADRGGFRWAAILGEDELARDVVTLRDLESGEQLEVPRAKVPQHCAIGPD